MLGEGPDGVAGCVAGRAAYYLRSFGCQMNDHDAERIAGLLEEMGLAAARDARGGRSPGLQHLLHPGEGRHPPGRPSGLAARLKKEDPSRLVVVAGCLAQSRREEFFADFPFVDVLVGPAEPARAARAARAAAGAGERRRRLRRDHHPVERGAAPDARGRALRPGCRSWPAAATSARTASCRTCAGRRRRARPRTSWPRWRDLAAAGVREVTFLGQNVNAYGKEPGFAGSETLRATCCEQRLRGPGDRARALHDLASQGHVRGADRRAWRRPNQVCEHLHLPVQSGSDRILAAMRRGYDRAGYSTWCGGCADAVPDLALTTDLIVGFPGETEDGLRRHAVAGGGVPLRRGLHLHLLAAARRPRPRRLPGRADAAVAEERMARLVELVQRLGRERNQALVGQTVEVMVERPSRQQPER